MMQSPLRSFVLLAAVWVGAAACDSSSDLASAEYDATVVNFNQDWQFSRADSGAVQAQRYLQSPEAIAWEQISLPHTAYVEPLVIETQQWQGTAFYRKTFSLEAGDSTRHLALKFEGAMHEAEVYLNGTLLEHHKGGYLPFVVDITDHARFDKPNTLLVRLNNEDNPTIPPGKPIETLDFNYFSGLYRNVYLLRNDKLHISDPIAADRVAAGGLRVHYSGVSDTAAQVHVQTDIANFYHSNRRATLHLTLRDPDGNVAAEHTTAATAVPADSSARLQQQLSVSAPRLWSPDHPHLYTLRAELKHDGAVIDRRQIRLGIRTIGFDEENGFMLNGKPLTLRGTNRHQSYPYIGYALSDNAQYRDAYKIKQAGFNFIRTAHYPPSPAFLEACDELGILFMNAIPGWQFFGGEEFQRLSLHNIRQMIRRDRNHPSVVIWEASLNESPMDEAFMTAADSIVHQELPFENIYSSGWLDYAYDIFIPARQHAEPPAYWNSYDKDKPLFIAEYGDWEYYAQNAGFNQDDYEDLQEEERNSRQLRGDGQKRLAQQALNFQEAHNSNLQGPAFGDANWVMFDYNRGYAPNLEASGIRDIFRIPKFAYYFYRSQAGPDTTSGARFGRPMIYIANYWSDSTYTTARVYSNTDEVELFLNGRSLGRKQPDRGRVSTHLKHPPFTFEIERFEPGTLRAVGYLGEEAAAEHQQVTPGKASALKLEVDRSGRSLRAGQKDVVFVYASVTDSNGTRLPSDQRQVRFHVEGDAALVGENPIAAEAGIAAILLRAGSRPGSITLRAEAEGVTSAEKTITVSGEN